MIQEKLKDPKEISIMQTKILLDHQLFSFKTEDLPQKIDEYNEIYIEIIDLIAKYPVILARFLNASFVEAITQDWRIYQGRNGGDIARLIINLEVFEDPKLQAAIIDTASVPELNEYWCKVLSDIGSNCSPPHWRNPMIFVANFEERTWPTVNELVYSSGGLTRQRILVQLESKQQHPYFEQDMDPWRLQTSVPPASQEDSRENKRSTWKRLPRPRELSCELTLLEIKEKLRSRFKFSKTDPLIFYIPPQSWDPFSASREEWRDGKSFPQKIVQDARSPRRGMSGHLDRDGRIWVWHDEESHWDVQFEDGASHINVSYTGKNLSI